MNCQNALRPILPKSQAWCVDGDRKFVLQIRPPQYWRIEVPNTTAAERLGVEELKKVLDQVLRFEKTPCPFERDFTVELPEEPQTPIKKRPWRPVERHSSMDPLERSRSRSSSYVRTPASQQASPKLEPIEDSKTSVASDELPKLPATPDVPRLISRIETSSQTQDAKIFRSDECSPSGDQATQVLPNDDLDELESESVPVDTAPTCGDGSLQPSLFDCPESEHRFDSYVDSDGDNDSFSDATDDTGLTPKARPEPSYQSLSAESDREKPQALQNCSRSITAPPVLSLITSPPSKHRTKSNSPLRYSTTVDSVSSLSSSVDSFHSVQSWHSPLAPPSPPSSQPSSPVGTFPYPHENIVLPKRPAAERDVSEQTNLPETPHKWDLATNDPSDPTSPPPKTPPLVNDDGAKSDEEPSEVATPPTVRPQIRHRATTSSNSRRRALSPLPPAVNLFSPPRRRPRKLQTARHLPTAIIQKTCEILLSPPSHLFHLMISIATKIAAGEWRGMLSSHGEAVHWDFEDEYGSEAWFEDDYNMGPPRLQSKTKTTSSNAAGGSWEVD